MENKKLVILAQRGVSTNITYNALKDSFNVSQVIIESPVNILAFLKSRIKKLGLVTVFGQILFQLLIIPILNSVSRKRKKEIKKNNNLIDKEIPEEKIIRVESVNSPECIKKLQEISPDLVVINGTRIINDKVLRSTPCKFINMHAGITPKYRGVHGAYWAAVQKDLANCGVTIHFVDSGIDTGEILQQEMVHVEKKDNFTTYPLLQIAIGIKLLKQSVTEVLSNNYTLKKNNLESHIWSHPTFFQYINNLISKKVK